MAATLSLGAGLASAEPRPIVYMVVIDGLDGDRIDGGRAPFIASLLEGNATYYRESRSVMPAETNPNHTAMVTGAYSGQSGIAGNQFAMYAPLENEDSCKPTGPIDETKMPSATSGENANCLLAETLFASVKRQGNPDSLRTAAIFGKPKLGRIFAGRTIDPKRRDVDYLWAPCSSGPDDDEYCGDVPTNPVTGYGLDDSQVMDEVLRSMRDGVGTPPRRPDFTFVNLHQVDSAGHAFTPSGAYDETIAMADQEVQRLVAELQARDEWKRTVLIILSDHSMDATFTKTSLTSAFEDAGIPSDSFLALHNGSLDSVYLANRADRGRFELLKKMRAAALATGQVDEALYRQPNPADGNAMHAVDTVHPAWRMTGPRSPDLIVTHKLGGAFTDPSMSSNPVPGGHGGPLTSDNFYAVIGGGPFVRKQTLDGKVGAFFDDTLANPSQAENADGAATVAGLLGLGAPADNAGRFLAEAFDLGALPGNGRPAAPRVGARRAGKRRYRLHLEGPGDRFDVQMSRNCGRWRSFRTGTAARAFALRARRRSAYRFRARSTAASGVTGSYGPVKLVARRRKC